MGTRYTHCFAVMFSFCDRFVCGCFKDDYQPEMFKIAFGVASSYARRGKAHGQCIDVDCKFVKERWSRKVQV